jgi:hypothetical protein
MKKNPLRTKSTSGSDTAKGRLEHAPKFTDGGIINLGIVPEPRPIAKGLPQIPKFTRAVSMRLQDKEM